MFFSGTRCCGVDRSQYQTISVCAMLVHAQLEQGTVGKRRRVSRKDTH